MCIFGRVGIELGSVPAPLRTLYVFIDESGNFDFTAKGTDHFILSAVYTADPCKTAAPLQALKYDLLAAKSNQLEFHASENSRGTRARVASVIQTLAPDLQVHTIWADKHYAHPKFHDAKEMLALFGMALARWISSAVSADYDQIVLVFDSVLTGKQRDAFLKAVKPLLKGLHKPFHVAFHPVKSDLNGQIADYFAWSMFRNLEVDDPEPLRSLQPVRHTMFNIFRNGNIRYW